MFWGGNPSVSWRDIVTEEWDAASRCVFGKRHAPGQYVSVSFNGGLRGMLPFQFLPIRFDATAILWCIVGNAGIRLGKSINDAGELSKI